MKHYVVCSRYSFIRYLGCEHIYQLSYRIVHPPFCQIVLQYNTIRCYIATRLNLIYANKSFVSLLNTCFDAVRI